MIDDVGKEEVLMLLKALEKQNNNMKELLDSKEYRIGSSLYLIKKNIKSLNFKDIYMRLKKRKLRDHAIVTVNNKTGSIMSECKEHYFSNARIAIYTAIFGNYDKVHEPLIQPKNIDYYIITDQEIPTNSLWKPITPHDNIKSLSPSEKNRYVKMHPDEYFSRYKYSIYVDGSISIISDMTPLIYEISKVGIAVHRHSQRECVYDELIVTELFHKITSGEKKNYEKYLEKINMPKKYGLCECGVIAREHEKDECKRIMAMWWEMFKNHIKRDQIHLPVVLFLNNISVNEICTLGTNIYNNKSILINYHN